MAKKTAKTADAKKKTAKKATGAAAIKVVEDSPAPAAAAPAPSAPPSAPEKRGRKAAVCPKCQIPTKTNDGKCVVCGTPKPKKPGNKGGRPKKTAPAEAPASVSPVMALLGAAKSLGGIDAAIDTLRAIKAAK